MFGLVAQLGTVGGIVALALVCVRTLVVAVVALWSLRADQKGRKHALDLLRVLKLALPSRDRSP
ncbi:MAG TPA: hypothetical protein VNO31_23370 [Umezawaea sp.]|nr:hypothetical protein [Umezawaea sp.]